MFFLEGGVAIVLLLLGCFEVFLGFFLGGGWGSGYFGGIQVHCCYFLGVFFFLSCVCVCS